MDPRTNRHWESAISVVLPQINRERLHVWPFDLSFPLDVRFFQLNRPHDIPLHRPDHFELVYLESGRITTQIQAYHFTVRKGDLLIIGNGKYNRCRRTSPSDPPARAIVLSFLPELLQAAEHASAETHYLLPFMVQDSAFPHVVPAETGIPSRIMGLTDRICAELPATSPGPRRSTAAYLRMILGVLINHYMSDRHAKQLLGRAQGDLGRLQPVLEFLRRHLADRVSVQDAASIEHMSRWQFMRFFGHATGQSFIGYLNHLRLAQAQRLLASTSKPLSEISQEIGFCSQSYFGLLFREAFNLTPSEYRRRFHKTSEDPPLPLSLPGSAKINQN